MLNVIKQRKGKISKNRVWIKDKELSKTLFQPGTAYRYIADLKNKKLIILPAEDGTSAKVASINDKGSIRGIIDIRKKEALAALKGCQYLQLTIYNEQILVEGYVEAKDCSAPVLNTGVLSSSKIIHISQLIQVRHKAQISMSLAELKKVAGDENGFFRMVREVASPEYEYEAITMWDYLKSLLIPLKAISYFSGAGLLDLGFIKEGFSIVKALDYNDAAVATYRQNIGDHIICADITNYTPAVTAPVIIAGSPCQKLSSANRKDNVGQGETVEKAVEKTLIEAFIDKIRQNSDGKVVVCENVPQILTANGGAVYKELVQSLPEYEFTPTIEDVERVIKGRQPLSSLTYNSVDVGSAQCRERAIITASKIGRITIPQMYNTIKKTVREAFSGLKSDIPNQQDVSSAKPESLKRMEKIRPGENWRALPEELRTKSTHSTMYHRLEMDMPSITIVNPRKGMILHPEENRILSVRECARLQDLDDDFVFTGSLADRQQQVANGVPLKLARYVAKHIRHAIDKANEKYQLNFCVI